MVGCVAGVRAGARKTNKGKDAGRSEPKRVREPEDAEIRRYGESSACARVAEFTISRPAQDLLAHKLAREGEQERRVVIEVARQQPTRLLRDPVSPLEAAVLH